MERDQIIVEKKLKFHQRIHQKKNLLTISVTILRTNIAILINDFEEKLM